MTALASINVTYREGQFRIFSMPVLPAVPPMQLINHLIVEAEKLWEVPAGSVKSARRSKEICLPRFAVIYAARRMTTRSYPEIGRMIGGRDHSTIIHGHDRAQELRRTDPDFAAMLAHLIMTVYRARRSNMG